MAETNIDDLRSELDDLKASNKELRSKLSEATTALKATESLKAENVRLAGEHEVLTSAVSEAKADARARRIELREAEKLRDQHAETVTKLTGDIDLLKQQVETAPGEYRAKVEELTGVVRTMKHEKAFDKVLTELKVTDPAKRRDLLKLANYVPEGDEPDEAKIKAKFSEEVKDRSYLLDPDPASKPPESPAVSQVAATTNGTGTNGNHPTNGLGGTTPHGSPAGNGKPGAGHDRGSSLAGIAEHRPASQRIPGKFGNGA